MELSVVDKKAMINVEHKSLSVRRQCALINLERSSLYYHGSEESYENLELMRLLDEEYMRHPFKGVLRMVEYLSDLDHIVNPKRVRRLLRSMGIMAIYPKRNLSKAHPAHKKYPYLLKGMDINKANQVWCTDFTYIRLNQGFVYLVAVMDWYSRYVLSWRLSNSMDASFCIEALEDALLAYGKPVIFNSDQGSQYTCDDFIELLLANDITISMDGKGRAFDNIFIERLWRSVKYEEVYIKDYANMVEAKNSLAKYFQFYNYERHHQGLEYKKPAEVYFDIRYKNHQAQDIEMRLNNQRKINYNICLNSKQISESIH
jgi:putative transposase